MLTVQIEDYSHKGEGVGRIDGRVVFVPQALKGELVRVEIIEEKKKYLRGRLLEVIQASPKRVRPMCSVASCGSCQLQHMNYEEQLYFKENRVRTALRRLGGFAEVPAVEPILGMDNPWHYRHTARFHVKQTSEGAQIGFYAPGTHELVPVADCRILPLQFPLILEDLTHLLAVRSGEVNEVVLRKGRRTGEILVLLSAGSEIKIEREELAPFMKKFPKVKGVVLQCPNAEPLAITGRDYYRELLAGVEFQVPAKVFFQNNPFQAEKMAELAFSLVNPTKEETVFDLYAGVGLFALVLASQARFVYAFEEDQEAVAAGEINARLNRLENVRFLTGKVERTLPKLLSQSVYSDVCILDPPRSGAGAKVLDLLLENEPKKILYISCNPETLARDLSQLKTAYQIETVQPIDMFPQTAHVETVVLMSRVDR